MALTVMVLYDDLSIRTEPYANIDALPKGGVLAISLTTAPGDRQALVARAWGRQPREKEGLEGDWWGTDNYAIVEVQGNRFFTDQWDDDDESWPLHDLDGPAGVSGALARPKRFPSSATVHQFKGTQIDPAAWRTALAKFEAEMF